MTKELEILCPYCSAPYTKKMLDIYEEGYGCDTGCTTVSIDIKCRSCGKEVYVKNGFGGVEDEQEREDIIKGLEQWEINDSTRQ